MLANLDKINNNVTEYIVIYQAYVSFFFISLFIQGLSLLLVLCLFHKNEK